MRSFREVVLNLDLRNKCIGSLQKHHYTQDYTTSKKNSGVIMTELSMPRGLIWVITIVNHLSKAYSPFQNYLKSLLFHKAFLTRPQI